MNVNESLNLIRERKPEDEDEAASRFDRWRRCDPYPNVSPGLLSSARFCDYIVETGMVYPFNVSKDDIKIATHAFRVEGRVVRWTDDNKKHSFTVGVGNEYDTESFQLRQDSIAFVTLQPYLRIPEYIALRFNLKINNVYRGLLLGTGPIVDPGYEGKLSIPLHNLTTNHYVIKAKERLVWVEFTKIHSTNGIEDHDGEEKQKSDLHIPFFDEDEESEERDVEYHIREAEPHRSIRSSIPNAIHSAEEAAEEARDEAEDVSAQATRSFYISLGILAVGLISILAVSVTYILQVDELEEEAERQQAKIQELERRLDQVTPPDSVD